MIMNREGFLKTKNLYLASGYCPSHVDEPQCPTPAEVRGAPGCQQTGAVATPASLKGLTYLAGVIPELRKSQ